jgi:hypothetical protein
MITITYILMMMAETQCYSDVRFFMTDLVSNLKKRFWLVCFSAYNLEQTLYI